MGSLIEDVPEASEFVERVLQHPERFFLFQDEPFARFEAGVFATSGVDRRGDRISPEALSGMVDTLQSSPVWMFANHNPLIHPIGRILAADVFTNPESEVHFIAGVFGYFDPIRIPRWDGELPDVAEDAWNPPEGDPPGPQAQLAFDSHEIAVDAIAALLEHAPEIVARSPEVHTRKGIEAQAILQITVAAWLLMADPFSRAFLSRLGTRAADGVVEFYKWIGREVIDLLMEKSVPPRLLRVTMDHGTAEVHFLVPAQTPRQVIGEALKALPSAARSATAFLYLNERVRPRNLTFVYDADRSVWSPSYFVCDELGVLAANPEAVDFTGFRGLSIGAVIKEIEVSKEDDGN